MTERLNCGNCGGPLTRAGRESSITCGHCQHVTDVGSPGGNRRDDEDDDDSSSSESHEGHIPAIIVINAGGGGPGPSMPQPQVTRTVVVRSGSSFSFIAPLIFIAIAVSASLAIRHHIMNSIPSIPASHEAPHPDDHHAKHGH
jgi:hypothetical protein